MRFFALVLAGALLGGSVAAQGQPGPQLAAFQQRTITDSGLDGTHSVALTFDDGPDDATRAVLDALKQEHVTATFFVVGRMAKAHPDVLAEIAADGDLLANHTMSHPHLDASFDAAPQMLLDQLEGVQTLIAPFMAPGERLFFRAPYGMWTEAHAAILNADPALRAYIGPVFWDAGGQTAVDGEGYVMASADWDCWKRGWTAQVCAKGYLREVRRKNGGVIVMHCIDARDAELVKDVVPALIGEGYSFLRLDRVQGYDRYVTPRGKLASR